MHAIRIAAITALIAGATSIANGQRPVDDQGKTTQLTTTDGAQRAPSREPERIGIGERNWSTATEAQGARGHDDAQQQRPNTGGSGAEQSSAKAGRNQASDRNQAQEDAKARDANAQRGQEAEQRPAAQRPRTLTSMAATAAMGPMAVAAVVLTAIGRAAIRRAREATTESTPTDETAKCQR